MDGSGSVSSPGVGITKEEERLAEFSRQRFWRDGSSANSGQPPWAYVLNRKWRAKCPKRVKVCCRTSAQRICRGYGCGNLRAEICCSPAWPLPCPNPGVFYTSSQKYACWIEKDKIGRWKHFGFPPAQIPRILHHNKLTKSGGCLLFYWRWLQGVSGAFKDCVKFVI